MHPFLIVQSCYWHHEWERCGVCSKWDKPDDPELPEHTHHDETVEKARMEDLRSGSRHGSWRLMS